MDTIGIEDTDLKARDVAIKIDDLVRKYPEGFNGIFFVFDSKFTDSKKYIFNKK